MEEEDYFRDQRRRDRGSNFVGSYRRPGSSEFFNPAETILAGIEAVESSIGKRKKTVRDFENAAAIRKQEMIDAIQNTEGMEDTSAIDSLQAELMAQVDELHRLDIASFEGDRSGYLKKSKEVNKIAKEIPALMGLIDAEGVALDEAIMSGKGLDKSVLKSNKEDYYNFVDDARKGGKNISFKIKNGNLIAQLNGKDVFNGSAFIKSKEKGFDLINYVKDYGKEMNDIDAEASKNLKSLVKATKIESLSKDGKYITTEQKNDYKDAVKAYREALERNIGIDAITNESTFQTFIGGEERYQANDEQNDQTKEAIIDEMVKNKFPMYNKVTGKAIGDVSETRELYEGTQALKRQKELINFKNALEKSEQQSKGDPASEYVIDISSKLQNAANINDVNSVKEIIETQLASTSGFNPDNIKIEGGTITIQSDAVEQKTYSPEQIKKINEISNNNIGRDIVSSEGFVTDQDNMKALIRENPSFANPNGEVKTKPSDVFVIEDWTSPKGISKLTTIMVDKKYTKAKSSVATQLINKIFDEGKRVEAAGKTEEFRIENIDNIKRDIESFYKDISTDDRTTEDKFFSYSKGRGKEVYKMIERLPKNYKVELYGVEVNPLEYIKSNQATNEDVYNGLILKILEDAKTNPELKNIDLSISKYIPKNSQKLLDD